MDLNQILIAFTRSILISFRTVSSESVLSENVTERGLKPNRGYGVYVGLVS